MIDPQQFVDRRAIALLAHDRSQLNTDTYDLGDAFAGAYGGVECRFMFDPRTGNLETLELFRTVDDDPCELHFSDYAEIEGRVFPRQIECRYGDAAYAVVKLSDVKLEKAGGK